jgi:multicomponent Na+:H+ antiporter subunit B
MSRTARMIVFGVGAAGVGVALLLAFLRLPTFGTTVHPYRDLAVGAAIQHSTANVISSINFDQRALDTLGEEIILMGSVMGAVTLLRTARGEREGAPPDEGRVLPATRLLGYLLLPVTLLIGFDVVLHGHLTPGGGFQGGVVLATGLHLAYLTGRYQVLRRLRPLSWYTYGEALGAGAFAVLGVVGLVASSAFLANFLPFGQFEQPLSAGALPLLNFAVGCEVASGVVVLLAAFLKQALVVEGGSR